MTAVNLSALKRKADATRRAKAEANRLEAERNALALGCAEKGATYAQVADAMGVKTDRVTQVLRKERDRQAEQS